MATGNPLDGGRKIGQHMTREHQGLPTAKPHSGRGSATQAANRLSLKKVAQCNDKIAGAQEPISGNLQTFSHHGAFTCAYEEIVRVWTR